jgi:hypothetical protein
MRLKTFFLILLLVVLFSNLACSEKHEWSRKEAEGKAFKALESYAMKEEISVDRFEPSAEKTYFDKKAEVWVVRYKSSTKPVHRVNIIVDQFGNTELHREISVNDKVEK